MAEEVIKTMDIAVELVDGRHPTFQEFTRSQECLLPTFKRLLKTLSTHNIHNYQILIKPQASSTNFDFSLSVIHSGWSSTGPRSFPSCLSCHPDKATIADNNYPKWEQDANLATLDESLKSLASGECELSLNADNERSRMLARHARSWMDAQARPMVVVTPRRHVGGMDEMTDEEIVGLWGMVGEVVGLWVEPPASQVSRFKRIVLNAGTFRNIEHAHVKIYFETMDFISRMSSWPPQLHDLYNRLYALRRHMKRPNPQKILTRFDTLARRHQIFIEGTFTTEDTLEITSKVIEASRHKDSGGIAEVQKVDIVKKEGCTVEVVAAANVMVNIVLELHLTRLGTRNLVCKVRPVGSIK